MNVKIEKIMATTPRIEVLCKTDYGNVILVWKGNIPIRDKEYYIELESNEILIWNKNICISDKELALGMDEYGIIVVGELESLDEDGYLILRLGDNIISFLSQNVEFKEGIRVKINIRYLEAYPIEY